MLEVNFEKKLNRTVGFPSGGFAPTKEQVAFAREHVSNTYAEFIETYGYGLVRGGRFQFCPIDVYRPLAALIFKADPDFSHNDCFMLGFDAFGMRVTAWSEKYWNVEIDLLQYTITSGKLAPPVFDFPIPVPKGSTTPVNRETMTRGILPGDKDSGECWDWRENKMFDRCVGAYGALEFGEAYGFFPALGMVGYESRSRAVESVRRIKALEYFCMIAQMRNFDLVRHNRGRNEVVRPIG